MLFRVILGDAARDELLEQFGLPIRIARAADVRQRVPELFQYHEQLLGVDFLRSRFGGGSRQNVLKLLSMVAPPHGALHNVSKSLERVGIQAWRMHPIEGHHGSSTGRAMVGA
ncbi:MAG TPA: hypothetical protein VJN70_07400 [Gemmatimonadaceae bacterium]|nr:hypothetical protein [Gemmatimonadaceae bacterium]